MRTRHSSLLVLSWEGKSHVRRLSVDWQAHLLATVSYDHEGAAHLLTIHADNHQVEAPQVGGGALRMAPASHWSALSHVFGLSFALYLHLIQIHCYDVVQKHLTSAVSSAQLCYPQSHVFIFFNSILLFLSLSVSLCDLSLHIHLRLSILVLFTSSRASSPFFGAQVSVPHAA